MAKSRKNAAASDIPLMPQVGDKVTKPRSESILEITHVSKDGTLVNLHVPGTDLEWFRVKADTLTFVDREPLARTSNPFTSPEPVFDGGELLERIETAQRDSLKQSDDDIDILKAYLKTQRALKPAIEALEGFTIDQHKGWKIALGKIKKALGE